MIALRPPFFKSFSKSEGFHRFDTLYFGTNRKRIVYTYVPLLNIATIAAGDTQNTVLFATGWHHRSPWEVMLLFRPTLYILEEHANYIAG